KLIQFQPLRWSADASRKPDADHELIGRFELLPPPFVSQIAVVLLIDSMKLHQLHVVRRGNGPRYPVQKSFGNRTPEIVARSLHPLVGAQAVERLRKVVAAIDGVC